MRCIIMREGWYLYYHYLLISILFFPFYEYVGRDFLPCNESIVDEPLLEYWIQNAITLNDAIGIVLCAIPGHVRKLQMKTYTRDLINVQYKYDGELVGAIDI